MSNEDSAMNGEDFSQDVSAENAHSQNGAGDAPQNESGSADIPGRDDDRKLFVGGMSWETTDKELREYFGKYGEIESINVKTDPNTGRSRGFAFIVFTNTEAIDKVLNAGDHIINGKKIDPKKAKARHGKIFVGGLTAELSDDDIKNYFGQFGQILEVEMPFDKTKNQRKAFCFITFESEQVVNDLLKMPKQKINEVEVDVKKATPRLDQMSPMSRGGRGGRGAPRGRGGRGGYNGWNQGYGSYNSYSYPYDGYNQTDYYGGGGGYGNYGGYDYYAGSGGGNYVQGYGYNGGYGSGRGTLRGRGGPGGGGGGYQGNKPRGGGAGNGPQRQQRHQPY